MPKKSKEFSEFVDRVRDQQKGSIDDRPMTEAEIQMMDLIATDADPPTKRDMLLQEIDAQKKMISILESKTNIRGKPYDLTEERENLDNLLDRLDELDEFKDTDDDNGYEDWSSVGKYGEDFD